MVMLNFISPPIVWIYSTRILFKQSNKTNYNRNSNEKNVHVLFALFHFFLIHFFHFYFLKKKIQNVIEILCLLFIANINVVIQRDRLQRNLKENVLSGF